MFVVACGGAGGEKVPALPRTVVMQLALPTTSSKPVPQGASLHIRVIEVSGADRAVAGTLVSSDIRDGAEYQVECKASSIREQQVYGLEVAVVFDGKALLRNTAPYYVLTRGNPDRVRVELK